MGFKGVFRVWDVGFVRCLFFFGGMFVGLALGFKPGTLNPKPVRGPASSGSVSFWALGNGGLSG